MNSLFDNRFLTLLLSFFLAVVLWFYVHGEFQIRQTLTVKLNYLKTDQYVPVGKREKTLSVIVRGPAAMVRSLAQQEHRLEVDLADVRPGPVAFGNFEPMLRKEFPRDVEILSVHPREIEFEVDVFATKHVPLFAELSGQPADGFQVSGYEMKPERVHLAGANKVLSQISSFKAGTISVSGIRSPLTQDLTIDPENQDIWVVGNKKVQVSLQVQEKIVKREVQVPVQMLHTSFNHTISPPAISLTVEGPYGIIQGVSPKDFLAFIDAEGMKPGIYRRPIAIKPPNSVKLLDNSPRFFSLRIWKEDQ